MEETGKTEEAEEVEEAEELVAYGPKPACRMHGVRQVFIKSGVKPVKPVKQVKPSWFAPLVKELDPSHLQKHASQNKSSTHKKDFGS